MNETGMLKEIKARLEQYKKPTWIPKTKLKDAGSKASKFSGVGALSMSEEWPLCWDCNQPMQLLLQLNSQELPIEMDKPFGEGLLQVFFCTNIGPICETYDAHETRVLPFDDISKYPLKKSPVPNSFPEATIVAWELQDDFPDSHELLASDFGLTKEQKDYLYYGGEGWSELAYNNDKLLGWPNWIQYPSYPKCTKCGEIMNNIFQLGSQDNLPYMFGDSGIGYIMQCLEHKEIVRLEIQSC